MASSKVQRRITAMLGLIVLVSIAAVAPVKAAESDPLYQSTVIVTGYDMRSRPGGFARALRDVLVKLSGDPRLEKDPRVAELGKHPDSMVTSFDYVDLMAGIKVHDDQGTYDRSYNLTVRFDPARIDQTLEGLGQHPWRGTRPVVVPVIAMHGPSRAYLVRAEDPATADQRQSFATIAHDYSLNARMPTEAELAAWGASAEGAPAAPPASRDDEAIVAGTLAFEDGVGWNGAWAVRWHGTDYTWKVAGVNYDEAFRDAVRGVLRIASGHDSPE